MTEKKRILIAEDDDGVRKMLETYLGREYTTVPAVGGYQALAATMKSDRQIDLIVTDLDMPGLNGVELIENLLDDTPVIVVSAYLDDPDLQQAMVRLKPLATFRKPFSVSDLGQKIRDLLG